MKKIEIKKIGYDFGCEGNLVFVPYMATKQQIVGFCKAMFGEDAFRKYTFVIVR